MTPKWTLGGTASSRTTLICVNALIVVPTFSATKTVPVRESRRWGSKLRANQRPLPQGRPKCLRKLILLLKVA